MQIALISGDRKKELMTQFCIAYCGILSKHKICATAKTGRCVAAATGLDIELLLAGDQGGVQQVASRVAYDEIDMILFFRDSGDSGAADERSMMELLRLCDIHNVPTATNIATAEVLVMAMNRGDFDWREIVNPKSEYNRKKQAEEAARTPKKRGSK